MPRRAREKSSTGIYHVMLRGINRQIIFEDNEDYNEHKGTVLLCCSYVVFVLNLWSN